MLCLPLTEGLRRILAALAAERDIAGSGVLAE